MMEIKLCPHFKPTYEYCQSCAIDNPIVPMGLDGAERACSDCEKYAPLSLMVGKYDGRVICADCQTKLDRSRVEKAQPYLFVEQKGLFQ
jgi:hypothetical protein